jgi:hypothetical protein
MPREPKAVTDAAKKAEELIAKAAKQEEENLADDDAQASHEGDYIVAVDDIETDVDDEVVTDDEPEGDEDDEAALREKEDKDDVTDDGSKEKDAAYWEQRFNVIQGKYNHEVPLLAQQVKQLMDEVKVLKQEKTDELADVSSELEFSPEDFEDYGDEFVKLAKAFKAVEARNKQLEQLAQTMQTSQAGRDGNTFKAEMTRLCPKWETINDNPNFITWLQEEEGISGRTRHYFLNEAHQALNAVKVANIFNKFVEESAIPEGKNKKPGNKNKEVSPNSAKVEGAPQGKEKVKYWKRSEIAKFYRDLSDDKIPAKVAKKLEADIFLANQEGRIRD